ncbi:hypothetical protein CO057_01855 [Candidatus Uhrbacteria bacterium CG_4_9_14_0_2_um_filter_41_50]|uniref:Peptidase C39-like domain-containing protein n=1 Tax=Candidatus Uhrbacteria bacterium CG_4_9_14_0_2_um_filter_41_50 TaxID=1975031 RepID=A0A2M8EPF9_9BACT|nr:MAG: hypothetical protein COZ45_01175 [Candidatus Uhrbacteria bacterium CG_4_10_14_3_um_filter_41_21]PIZ54876.1 MAG: hypothetical protein COY24_02290 [Candidatus Uhrbacteria bacterium CG_4_10_14_0_2_um_filter_41_21]PJB84714.1 MAG: hypothetical protein CO086_02175 [Candidatus Uhrbacteria bacterium CG_4_9_14_0_8_um_filter_41_16]PJC24630.1 MAG: hypothetical protein CO057_01855 [Candidatus Uhrbacteria bacterium CG_4_9_14_0_2_um_filter_41_50]PJE75402.1 MAG: hypothetical protein COV03_00345 [Candi
MKTSRIISILSLTIILSPVFAFAAELSDCDAETIDCSCDPYPQIDSSKITVIDDCYDQCSAEAAAGNDDISGYTLQCEIAGVLTTIDQDIVGSVGAAFDDSYYASPELSVEIPGLSFTPAYKEGGSVNTNYLGEYIQAVYSWLIPAASLLAVVMMMIGGLQWMLARGDSGKIGNAKTKLKNATTGLVLLLAAYSITYVVDPNLLTYDSLSVSYIEAEWVSTENTSYDVTDPDLDLSDPPSTESDVPSVGTNGVTYYTQRGNNTSYSCDTTVSSSGCGPTSAAMVYHHYGDSSATPSSVAYKFLEEGFRVCDASCNCQGTSWAAFGGSSFASSLGLKEEQISISNTTRILEVLGNDEPIIVSVGPSIFTSSGHFIVLTGVTAEGKIMINDPNSGITEATQAEVFEPLKFAVRLYK